MYFKSFEAVKRHCIFLQGIELQNCCILSLQIFRNLQGNSEKHSHVNVLFLSFVFNSVILISNNKQCVIIEFCFYYYCYCQVSYFGRENLQLIRQFTYRLLIGGLIEFFSLCFNKSRLNFGQLKNDFKKLSRT